jgi:hypothetical protein
MPFAAGANSAMEDGGTAEPRSDGRCALTLTNQLPHAFFQAYVLPPAP